MHSLAIEMIRILFYLTLAKVAACIHEDISLSMMFVIEVLEVCSEAWELNVN